MRIHSLAFTCMILTGLVMNPTTHASDRLIAGEPFPEPSFPAMDGKTFQLEALRGHKVVLHIFASW